jgi:nucleotide-binding universal stress UspA family protein
MFDHLLIPLDGSQLAESVLPVTAEIAKACGSSVTLIHILEKNAPSRIHGEHHLTAEAEAKAYLEQIKQRYFDAQQHVDYHVHAEEVTNIARSLVDHINELAPDLMIMCAHGSGGLRDIMVGSIAQQVIRQVKTPILLLQPEHEITVTQLNCFLVPLDGDPVHEQVLPVAARLAAALGANLHLLTVVLTPDSLTDAEGEAGRLLPVATRAMLDATEESSYEYLAEKSKDALQYKVQVTTEVQRGDPVQQIVQAASSHSDDLICLGTHGRSGMNAFWAGSLGARVINATHLPILLVPVDGNH